MTRAWIAALFACSSLLMSPASAQTVPDTDRKLTLEALAGLISRLEQAKRAAIQARVISRSFSWTGP